MARAYLGLGTNLGDRLGNLRAAIQSLGTLGHVAAVSRIYETAPLYVLDQPGFLNMAAALDCELAPPDLLAALKGLETELGRVRSLRYGPRQIDLDILLYEDQVVDLPHLSIPHPRLTERRFALVPLADIAAPVRHPGTRTTIAALLQALPPATQDDAVALTDLALD